MVGSALIASRLLVSLQDSHEDWVAEESEPSCEKAGPVAVR